MKKVLFLLLALISIHAVAQKNSVPVDMKVIQDSLSLPGYSYESLQKRFDALDTTLTPAEYRLLYYGFGLKESYNGYAMDQSEEIRDLINSEKAKSYKKANGMADKVLEEMPMSLDANLNKLVAMKMVDPKDPRLPAFRKRYHHLVETVFDSGDGLECESGFKVLYIADEYHLMYRYLEIEGVNSQALVGNCDRFDIKKGEYFPENTIYFDISTPFTSLGKMLQK